LFKNKANQEGFDFKYRVLFQGQASVLNIFLKKTCSEIELLVPLTGFGTLLQCQL